MRRVLSAARACRCTSGFAGAGSRSPTPPTDPRALALIGIAGLAGEMLHENESVDAAAVVQAAAAGDQRMSAPDRVLAPAVDLQLAEVALQVLRRDWPSIRAEARAAALAAVHESQQQTPAARRPGVVYL